MVKKLNRKKSLLGFVIAPLVGLLMIILIIFGGSFINLLLGIHKLNDPSTSSFVITVIIMGIPGMYLLAFLIGLPTTLLLQKYRLVKWVPFLYAGLVWGLLFFILLYIKILQQPPFNIAVLSFITTEFISSISFLSYWWIAVKERKDKTAPQTGRPGREPGKLQETDSLQENAR